MEPHLDEIYLAIRKRIVDLVYKPGEVLSEKSLIGEFSTSRTPVREALLRLEQDRLVNIIPRVGTYVSQVDIRSVKYAYEMKKNLEGLAAELAAERATEEQISELLSVASRFSSYDNVRDYSKCIDDDRCFHSLTRRASGNPLLIRTLDDLSVITVRFLKHIQYVEKEFDWYKGSINGIAQAIRARETEKARSEAEFHTEAFLSKLASYFFG